LNLPSVSALLDSLYVDTLQRILDRHLTNPVLVGIHTGGAWIAAELHHRLAAAGVVSSPLGTLDISFYRDDFSRIGLNPKVQPSDLPETTEGRHVLLVDDVLMTGRTIRAALNVLFEVGRPASVSLITLVDLQAAELPIKADITGIALKLPAHQRIKLTGPEPLNLALKTLG